MRSFQGDASHRYFRVAVMVRQTAGPSCTSILYPHRGRKSGPPQTSRGAFPDTTPPPGAAPRVLPSPQGCLSAKRDGDAGTAGKRADGAGDSGGRVRGELLDHRLPAGGGRGEERTP